MLVKLSQEEHGLDSVSQRRVRGGRSEGWGARGRGESSRRDRAEESQRGLEAISGNMSRRQMAVSGLTFGTQHGQGHAASLVPWSPLGDQAPV